MGWRRPMAYRQQSRGPRYVRCPICKKQVTGRTRRAATDNQVQFDLHVALAEHKRAAHSESEDDE